jgi:hypothetical protein
MKNITDLKTVGQDSLVRLVDLGKQQPEQVQTWGLTAAAAVAGALALAATAQGLLALLATLAAPPVALTIGAVGGGLAGWSFIQNQKAADATRQADLVGESEMAAVAQTGETDLVEPPAAS